MRTVLAFLMVFVFTFSVAGVGHCGHQEEKGAIKGTVTKIVPSEYEITIKDDKGKETKVKVKDTGGVKVGEGVAVKDGKVTKEVKPKTGGY